MSTNDNHVKQLAANGVPSFKTIDASIRTLNVDMEQSVIATADMQTDRIGRLLKIYAGVKPLLIAVAALPVIPYTWRAALALFNGALDAVEADFKAGKDL